MFRSCYLTLLGQLPLHPAPCIWLTLCQLSGTGTNKSLILCNFRNKFIWRSFTWFLSWNSWCHRHTGESSRCSVIWYEKHSAIERKTLRLRGRKLLGENGRYFCSQSKRNMSKHSMFTYIVPTKNGWTMQLQWDGWVRCQLRQWSVLLELQPLQSRLHVQSLPKRGVQRESVWQPTH